MLLIQDINVLIMDEPKNHMYMEAIEALNNALKLYEGTLIFVSHDREFVSSLATRVIDIKDKKLVNFHGTLDEYLDNQLQAQKGA
jgi:ATPase subunit of ABC transporter with duplicated ATPase domains